MIQNMDIKGLIKELCSANGVSGDEQNVFDIAKKHLEKYGWCDNPTYSETLASITKEDIRQTLKTIVDAGNLLEIKMKPDK